MIVKDHLRPEPGEYAPGLAQYIDLVPPDLAILDLLSRQQHEIAGFSKLPEEKLTYRYAPEKWSVKELIGHLIDSERVFVYRALRFSRGDSRAQDGFDENMFAAEAHSGSRQTSDLLEEFEAVRRSSIAYFRSVPPEALLRSGEANGKLNSVRGLAYFMGGHMEHHLNVLAERYGIQR